MFKYNKGEMSCFIWLYRSLQELLNKKLWSSLLFSVAFFFTTRFSQTTLKLNKYTYEIYYGLIYFFVFFLATFCLQKIKYLKIRLYVFLLFFLPVFFAIFKNFFYSNLLSYEIVNFLLGFLPTCLLVFLINEKIFITLVKVACIGGFFVTSYFLVERYLPGFYLNLYATCHFLLFYLWFLRAWRLFIFVFFVMATYFLFFLFELNSICGIGQHLAFVIVFYSLLNQKMKKWVLAVVITLLVVVYPTGKLDKLIASGKHKVSSRVEILKMKDDLREKQGRTFTNINYHNYFYGIYKNMGLVGLLWYTALMVCAWKGFAYTKKRYLYRKIYWYMLICCQYQGDLISSRFQLLLYIFGVFEYLKNKMSLTSNEIEN